jgi:hypothetical protein
MSDFADTPETYVAWRYLEVTDQLRPYDGERAEMLRGEEELDLLLAGTEYSLSPLLDLMVYSAELEKSPTINNIERFFKRALELRCFTQRSLARTLERYRCQNICIADLEARPHAYPDFGTEEEVRQHVAAIRRNDGDLTQLMAKIEEGQRSRSENERLLATLNTLIARRHGHEGDDESEPDTSHG